MDIKQFLSGMTRESKLIDPIKGLPDIYVRALTSGEIHRISKIEDEKEQAFWIIRYGVCKQDGTDMFSDSDLDLIKKMKIDAIPLICNAIKEMSKGKELPDIEKN